MSPHPPSSTLFPYTTLFRSLRDRRVDDPVRPDLLHQPRQRLEGMAGLGDVLADQEHARVAPHLLRDRLLHRLAVRQLSLTHDHPSYGTRRTSLPKKSRPAITS